MTEMILTSDARNEDYRTKKGLTPAQLAYDREWLRLKAIYAGAVRRDWLGLAFAHRPAENRSRGVTTYTTVPLTTAMRFVSSDNLDVIMLSDIPTRELRHARHPRFNVKVVGGHTDSAGMACVGGNDRFVHRQLDFSKAPIQSHPVFNDVMEVDRRRLKATRAGAYKIVKTDRWVDLCVGEHEGVPVVLYRLPNEPGVLAGVKFTKEKEVKADSLLATLKEPTPFFTAVLKADGSPVIDRIGNDVLCADRAPEFFNVLNRLHKLLTDMTLLTGSHRPATVPLDQWLPRLAWELPANPKKPGCQLEPVFNEAAVLERFCEGLGPRGDFQIRAHKSGYLKGLRPFVGQEHLAELVIEDAEGKASKLVVPATAIVRLEADTYVEAGEPVGDYCKRIHFGDYATVECVIGVEATEMVLKDFQASLAIRPGTENWDGPGCLYPADVLAEVPKGSRWVWDLAPAMEYLTSDGVIVGPAVHQAKWDDFVLGGRNTPTFDFTPAFGVLSGPAPVAPAPATATPKKRRRRRAKAK